MLSSKWKKLLFLLGNLCFILFMTVAGMVWVWAWRGFDAECSHHSPVTVVIPEGANLNQISQILGDSKAIDYPIIFKINVRLNKQSQALQAGEYRFGAYRTHRSVMKKLIDGETILHKLTIPEGLTASDILSLIKQCESLKGDITQPPQEGTLLPETYLFNFGETRDDLIKQMQADMQTLLDKLWATKAKNFPLQSIDDVLILASIVEKETRHDDERPRVAGVFLNRLKQNMPLQSDPTVTYGLVLFKGEPLGRLLNRQDLKIPTPYNTYLNNGLPKGPICNPGKASIEAVFNALDTDELYFVSDGDGRHIFSKTYKEHQVHHNNLRELRKKIKEANSQTEQTSQTVDPQ